MAESAFTERQLALLLQASRDFAFEQMAGGTRLVPFAARVKTDGEIEFKRFAEQDTATPFQDVYRQTRKAIAAEAARDELLAAALVAAVTLDTPQDGYDHAVRIHVEAPGYSRQVMAPYAVEPAADAAEKGVLSLGPMVPFAAAPVIFAA